MKKIVTLLSVAVLLCLLAACGKEAVECVHQWQAADCLNAKSCSLCGSAEGEALGHNWMEADCDSPMTCSRCAATEGEALGHDMRDATCRSVASCAICPYTLGEPLPHDYGNLTVSQSIMYRHCRLCGTQSKTVPRDSERYLEENLIGTWTCRSAQQYNALQNGYIRYHFPNDYSIVFQPGGALTFTFLTGETKTGFWTYMGDPGDLLMEIRLEFIGDGSTQTLYLSDTLDTSIRVDSVPLHTTYYFSQYHPYLEEGQKLLPGEWNSGLEEVTTYDKETYQLTSINSSVYQGQTLTFLEDGTFSSRIGNEKPKQGTWNCTDVTYVADSPENSTYQYMLTYNGDTEVYYAYYSSGDFTLYQSDSLRNTTYHFYQMSEEDFARIAKGQEVITGNWQSTTMITNTGDSDQTTENATDKYSLTVNLDGSFTGILPEECSGSWCFAGYEPESKTYRYYFLFDGETTKNTFYLSAEGILTAVNKGDSRMLQYLMEKQ